MNLFKSFVGYYRRFIEGFSRIAVSLTKLTQQTKFEWADDCKHAFQEPKHRSTTKPITLLDENDDFGIYIYSSRKDLGCVLMQNEKVVAYRSKQLKIHEKNCPPHDL